MDWVHCNRCYLQRSENTENVTYFMTSCGHIFCGRCTDGSNNKCLVQSNECTYSLLNVVEREHEALFTNPIILLHRTLKSLDFQFSQCTSLINFLKDRLAKYNTLKQEVVNLKSECKRHREEKNNLKNELIQKHEELRQLKRQLEKCQQARSNFFSDNMKSSESQGPRNTFGSNSSNSQLSFSPMARNTSQLFTPPKPVPFAKSYRDSNVYNLATPQKKSIFPSPPSSEYTPRPNLRTVLLPGDKASSPINRIGLQRLNLKCTPNFDRVGQSLRVAGRSHRVGINNSASKYNKYF